MPVYRLSSLTIEALTTTSFAERGIRERGDLQRLLKANIDVVAPGVLVISEEFGEWENSKRRIDLLGIDENANLVVIELKRDDEGGHMELQAIRYAAMVSSMTFARAIQVYQDFLDKAATGEDARNRLLEFLEWEEPREDEFGRNVCIVLVAADFSKELTTAVLWLNERDLDIRCVRLKPYAMGGETIIDAQQIVPLPELKEYIERIREKEIERREAARGADTGYWFMNTGDNGRNEARSWEDCKNYGFMLAGGGRQWIDDIRKLKPGDKLFAYLSRHGYVGFGEVLAESMPYNDFVPAGQTKSLKDLRSLSAESRERMNDPNHCDWCASVRWINAVDRDRAVLKSRARNGTLNRIRQADLVSELLRHFGGPEGNT